MIIRCMVAPISRKIERNVRDSLARGKSVILIGPRQTGKSTLIKQFIKPTIEYSFAKESIRQRYERDAALLELELEEQLRAYQEPPLVFIDEVQKVPRVMNVAQALIDDKKAQFILTGSSARKLKHGTDLNLLPGRAVSLTMTPLLYQELPEPKPSLEKILIYGTLPGMLLEENLEDRETDLYSYVSTYIEDEVRAEALVRNVGSFARFLEIAAGESGRQLNFTRLSQDIGVSDTTIADYYQILADCLITRIINPITKSDTKRRLIKSPKHLFFDLGVRRACANEGVRLPDRLMAHLFEHYVGNELYNCAQLISPHIKIKYWRDSAGPEIDYVIDIAQRFIPIEVKWSQAPKAKDARHLARFLAEYPQAEEGYIICRTPARYKVSENITAIPWQEIYVLLEVNLQYQC
ncbi:MAG: AAA family ATPase [Gammaproteobacteria bacterium]|nr:AAA family ATPase [Gammaproteobacteria bacterium]